MIGDPAHARLVIRGGDSPHSLAVVRLYICSERRPRCDLDRRHRPDDIGVLQREILAVAPETKALL
jgi:hypothetical protein